jgi:hypothetical protein
MELLGDDVIFDVADIHAGHYSAFLKLPGAFEYLKYLQDCREKEARKRSGSERSSPGGYVSQERLNPPCYRIWRLFKDIAKLCYELNLDLPFDCDNVLYSKFIGGGDYAWSLDDNYGRYERYTVEVFGLATRWISLIENDTRIRLPDRRQYATPPKYWYECPFEPVQIWRTRIFRSSPELFTPSVTNPLTPLQPGLPYLEERWHPNLANTTISFNGIDKSAGPPSMHGEFMADTYQILMRAPIPPTALGRPSRYKPLLKFYLEARKVYRQLALKSDRPSRKEIALRMNFSLTSFSRYWARTKIRWEDAHETFQSDLIPPQIL